MKRKSVLGIFFLILLVVFTSGYSVFNSIFPKAQKIEYPAYEDVVSVCVSCNNSDDMNVNGKDFESFISNIESAKPTRRQSVNDYPGEDPFYTIEIKATERLYRYYLYADGAFYIEIPYQGVYRSTGDFYDMVSKFFDT